MIRASSIRFPGSPLCCRSISFVTNKGGFRGSKRAVCLLGLDSEPDLRDPGSALGHRETPRLTHSNSMTFDEPVVYRSRFRLRSPNHSPCVAHRRSQDIFALTTPSPPIYGTKHRERQNHFFIQLVACLRWRVNHDREQYRHQHNDSEYMKPTAIIAARLSHVSN